MLEDVLSDVDALRHFGQHQTLGGHFEDSTFGDNRGALAAVRYAIAHRIGDLLGGIDELSNLAFLQNVPANSSRRALWAMSINPPAPGLKLPNLLTFTFPLASN